MLPAEADSARAVALGDVDGDGDLDAFVGNSGLYSGSQNRLLLNGGTGAFTDVTAAGLPVLGDFAYAVALGDVDGDGDLDAYVGGSGSFSPYTSPNRLFLGDGTGIFTDATATNLPAFLSITTAVAFGDVDGDGDLDAFVSHDGQNRLFTNLTNLARQLAWRGIPRAGKPLTLDVWGSANGTWLLAASAASADVPLGSFGTLRLYPPTLFIVAGGSSDAQGRARLTFPVPANPALVSRSLYWQAVVGPPLLFSNLEITTVTSL